MSAGEIMPCDGLERAEMSPVYNQSGSMGNSARELVITHGPAHWILNVATAHLSPAEARIWAGFMMRRNGRELPFTATRLLLNGPARNLGGPDGSIAISVNSANSTITLSGGSIAGYQASIGDMLSWRTVDDGFCLVQVVGDVDAVGTTAADIPVRPRPQAARVSSPDVRRVDALGEFRLLNPPPPFGDYVNRRLEFTARQVIR